MIQSKESRIQEEEYIFPYHYIPDFTIFPQHFRVWSWSYRYIAGLDLVLSKIANQPFESILDFGCGDGRFLNILYGIYGEGKKYYGVDISERAIAFANAFNFDSNIKFTSKNIIDYKLKNNFDLITSIEVIEHINPEMLNHVIGRLTNLLRVSGKLILTCPHVNKKLNSKHFQHFSKDGIKKILGESYKIQFYYFDKKSRWFTILYSFIYINPILIFTNKYINAFMYWFYQRFMFHCDNETNCERMLVVAEKIK